MEKNVLTFLLPFTIFITPLVPAAFGLGYEAVKVLVFLILTIISGFIYLYACSNHNLLNGRRINCDLHWTKIKIAGLVFLITLSITSIFGIHPFESMVGKYPYYQGLVLYWFLYLFFLMVSETGISIKRLSLIITCSALIVSLISCYQFVLSNLLNLSIPTYAGRVVSTFGQPNFYSGFLLLALPFNYLLLLKSNRFFLFSVPINLRYCNFLKFFKNCYSPNNNIFWNSDT